MDAVVLNKLQKLNQLSLTEDETSDMLSFFDIAEKDLALLDAVDTDNTLRMVHVMPMTNVIRDDIAKQHFTRDELQANAPEATDGYWQVPRLVD